MLKGYQFQGVPYGEPAQDSPDLCLTLLAGFVHLWVDPGEQQRLAGNEGDKRAESLAQIELHKTKASPT